MAYTPPTIQEFRARFPEFATTGDSMVTLLLSEAQRSVDDTWTEGDYPRAIMLLTAHAAAMVAQAGISGGTGNLDQVVTAIKFADRSISYAYPGAGGGGGGSSGSSGGLDETIYGLLYLELLQKNVPAVVVLDG